MPFIQDRPTIQLCADGTYSKPAEPGSYNLINERGRNIGWLEVESMPGESAVLRYITHLDLASVANPQPHRRFQLTLELDADTLEGLLARLDQIHFDIASRGDAGQLTMPHTSVTGGYDAGWILDIRDDPAMTHEAYMAEVTAWKERRRRASTAQEG